MKFNQLFITGTDTEIGKTLITCILANKYKEKFEVQIYKPVVAGLNKDNKNEDLESYKKIIKNVSDSQLSDYILPHYCSPNISAKLTKKKINFQKILTRINSLKENSKFLIMEGAGGIYCPINDKYTFIDLLDEIKIPVIVVCGIKLGAINHSILTLNTLKTKKINVLGWVANCVEKNKQYIIDENIKYIVKHTSIDHLGTIPYINKLKNKTIYSLTDIKYCEKFIKLP
jgi:dethiobiotin synthetase|tara:strand:- start:33 stop:719 length:687 start_codon:yes stop_codon:yes gene_type:complete